MTGNTNNAPNGLRQNGFRPKLHKVKKPRRWQHQDDLERAVGKTIILQRSAASDGGGRPVTMEGKLISADQFTFKILTKLGGELIVFKHSLNGYSINWNG